MKAAADDVTVLRTPTETSGGGKAGGRSGAATPRVLKQRFVLDEKLGSGGMGTVYRAKDLRKVEARDRHPYVAIKVLNNDFREHPEAFIALQREAAKSQGLSHRNIVSIYDFDKDGELPFIIMELLEGQELAELLRAFPTGMPDHMAWSVIRAMCEGLAHAHEAGLVHADFKPGNVFVLPNHDAKILDFGIARAVQINHAHGEDTVFDPTRLAALTPAYASREMLGGADAEVRDDLYSLGVVIYLMLTGRHPYDRLPADQAAELCLRPVRPKRLTRRQWRVLERCLSFERSERPASVREVQRYLFQPSPWRSRTALVAAAAVVVTFAVMGLKEDAAVEEARVEERQSTLLDAQVQRLAALAQAERFGAEWEAQVAEEVDMLRSLAPEQGAGAPVLAQIRARYRDEILSAADIQAGVDLYRRALEYGPMPEAGAHLAAALSAELDTLLDAPDLTTEWMNRVDDVLARYQRAFPGTPELAAMRLETVDVLYGELDASLAAERFPAARRALSFLETYGFDAVALDRLRTTVDGAEADFRARELAEARERARGRFQAQLTEVLSQTCLRFDPSLVASVLDRWSGSHPQLAADGRRQAGERVSGCLAQLEALDRDRALALRQRTEAELGRLPGLEGFRDDPCGATYLVGSGSQGGRRGSCADRLEGDSQGPRLVVVPADDGGRFAITRQEVSWAELAGFCQATGRCEVPADEGSAALPVSGIPLELARHYADWLSERTGFTYRLPSYAEWRQAAAGTSDPNRNCQVQLGNVHRGLKPVPAGTGTPNPFGLVNVLGNVQEWVLDDGQVKAAGGAFRDPIGDCAVATLRAADGAADPATGFRLVREVS